MLLIASLQQYRSLHHLRLDNLIPIADAKNINGFLQVYGHCIMENYTRFLKIHPSKPYSSENDSFSQVGCNNLDWVKKTHKPK